MAACVFRALDAVAVSTVGTAVDLGLPMPIISMQVMHTGTPTITVALQGSLDGTNYTTLTIWDSSVQTNGDIITASAFAGTNIKAYPVVKWVRANLTLSGGTAPTVIATIGAFGS